MRLSSHFYLSSERNVMSNHLSNVNYWKVNTSCAQRKGFILACANSPGNYTKNIVDDLNPKKGS